MVEVLFLVQVMVVRQTYTGRSKSAYPCIEILGWEDSKPHDLTILESIRDLLTILVWEITIPQYLMYGQFWVGGQHTSCIENVGIGVQHTSCNDNIGMDMQGMGIEAETLIMLNT